MDPRAHARGSRAGIPFAALSFVLVPLFSYLFLGERIGAPYATGVALTALGVVLCQH